MFILLYLLSLSASYIQYDMGTVGFYEEKITKKYNASPRSDEVEIKELSIKDFENAATQEVCEGKFLHVGDDIFIHGLIDKENLENIYTTINQETGGSAPITLPLSDKNTFFPNNPKRLIVKYIFQRKENEQTIYSNSYESFDLINTSNRIDFVRFIHDYKKLCLSLIKCMRNSYKLRNCDIEEDPPKGLIVNLIGKEDRAFFTNLTDVELVNLFKLTWSVIKEDFNEELGINVILEYVKKIQNERFENQTTSETSQNQELLIPSEGYFGLFRLLTHLGISKFKSIPINLAYFTPDFIDDGPISIYKAISLTFKDNLEDVSVKCFDNDKNELEIVQKYTIFNNRVIIFYDDIANQHYIRIKIGEKETDLIDIHSRKD
ncbi:hypothetical protein NGRA_2450 [Nosema granulosis]|uniref:Uncharacterized protein n=1 Tax=Nosema granulosis TaxID=83296 RepID=A0A9P6GY28_9MICR|nr:hypothetical protein NGRA_2450 [Nosema granulosis]